MPELPDIAAYLHALDARVSGRRLQRIRLASPFLLRSVAPPVKEAEGRAVTALRRLGKRIAVGLEGDLWLVIHLMIAGRLQWNDETGGTIPGGRAGLAAFDFDSGSLFLTEAGSKKRASLHVVAGEDGLAAHEPGGLQPLEIDRAAFAARLTAENRTLKRRLTDPRAFSGIGNAYSDEILLRAGLSPIQQTGKLSDEEIGRLFEAVQETLRLWIDRLTAEADRAWPKKVTAFRPEMAAHGRYGKPCPVCQTPIQRIVYAANECNYCPRCQTEGKVLADRVLSRLLKSDWPRTIEEWEQGRGG